MTGGILRTVTRDVDQARGVHAEEARLEREITRSASGPDPVSSVHVSGITIESTRPPSGAMVACNTRDVCMHGTAWHRDLVIGSSWSTWCCCKPIMEASASNIGDVGLMVVSNTDHRRLHSSCTRRGDRPIATCMRDVARLVVEGCRVSGCVDSSTWSRGGALTGMSWTASMNRNAVNAGDGSSRSIGTRSLSRPSGGTPDPAARALRAADDGPTAAAYLPLPAAHAGGLPRIRVVRPGVTHDAVGPAREAGTAPRRAGPASQHVANGDAVVAVHLRRASLRGALENGAPRIGGKGPRAQEVGLRDELDVRSVVGNRLEPELRFASAFPLAYRTSPVARPAVATRRDSSRCQAFTSSCAAPAGLSTSATHDRGGMGLPESVRMITSARASLGLRSTNATLVVFVATMRVSAAFPLGTACRSMSRVASGMASAPSCWSTNAMSASLSPGPNVSGRSGRPPPQPSAERAQDRRRNRRARGEGLSARRLKRRRTPGSR